MFLPEECQNTFPIDLLKRSECYYNYFLPADVYTNPDQRRVYDIECLSIFIAFPLIRKKNFSFMEGRKEAEKFLGLKSSKERNFGPQCLFEYHYPKKNTYDLDAVPTAKQLKFSS